MCTSSHVRDFWLWFARVAPILEADPTNHEALAELDRRVLALGDFGWEIGLAVADGAKVAFVLSPGRDSACFALARAIVARAPCLPGWEFHPAKPRKMLLRRTYSVFDNGEEIEFDADAWRFQVLQRSDGRVIVRLFVGTGLAPHLRELAADLVVEGEIGEEAMMCWVHDIAVVAEPAPADASPLADLWPHFMRVRGQ